MKPDPLFLVGHWRSGTTHLQNILDRDPQFGRVPLLQAGLPHDYLSLSRRTRDRIARTLPEKRFMDNVPVNADVPWEEELALAASCRFSFYHVSSFPKAMGRIFREAVLLEHPRDSTVWWQNYHRFLQQVQYTQPGKRLLLKNPANTARVRLLLERFPDARFIHLHRNPYKVFSSSVHLYLQSQRAWGLQPASREQVVAHVLDTYPLLMRAWLDQKRDIPERQLAEARFEDVQQEPIHTLRGIYRQLELEGMEAALPGIRAYLSEQRTYRKNTYRLSETEREIVAERWGDLFEELGYEI